MLYKYLLIVYNTEKISVKNNHENFSVDESLYDHFHNSQLWIFW